MVVQHNLRAMNSNRMLGLTSSSQSKSTEKLSSGYKINRAADDAAGLAISEKMRKQIRGLTQASANAQDGISAVQTAEGALTEVHDMIQRMNELATKSANGTNSQEERDYIQSEVDQLVKEIDRVAETTKFNELYLLKGGDEKATVTRETAAVEGKEAVAFSVKYKGGSESKIAVKSTFDFDDTVGDSSNVKWYLAGESTAMDEDALLSVLELDPADSTGKTIKLKDGVQIFKTAASTTDPGAQVVGGAIATATVIAAAEVQSSGLYKANDGAAANLVAEDDLGDYINEDGTLKKSLFTEDGDEIGAEFIKEYLDITPKQEAVAAVPKSEEEVEVSAMTLNLHVGAESATTNKISVTIKKMDAATLGVKGLNVSSESSATAAIDQLNSALRIVSEQRSDLGAVQNRLEHTINNLDNVVENTTAAESQIRDTDMATEMVKYSNNNILAQAGQAMLAQSNQANQGVLSLLQ